MKKVSLQLWLMSVLSILMIMTATGLSTDTAYAARLTAPQNVRVTPSFDPTSYQTRIEWNAVSSAQTYEYTVDGVNFRRICINGPYCAQPGTVAPVAYVETRTLIGKQFRVRAVGKGGSVGPLSAPLSF